MKRLFIYLTIGAMFATSACEDFLTINPVGVVSESALLNYEGIDMIITGMYSGLYNSDNRANIANFVYGDVMGGDANKGSTYNDQPDWTALELNTSTEENSYPLAKWVYSYDGIFKANSTESMIRKCEEELSAIKGASKDYYTEGLAQCAFIRGLYHFELIKNFGAAVPYVSLEDYESNVNPQVSNVDENGNYIYIWDKVKADFQYAYENLPEVWPATDAGRPNKWAALAFLGKVQVYAASPYNGTNGTTNTHEAWATAASTLKQVIDNGKDSKGQPYKLHESYPELFLAETSDWTGESIFDVQTTISGTQTNTNTVYHSAYCSLNGVIGGGWGFLCPSEDLAQSYYTDENGLPYYSATEGDFTGYRKLGRIMSTRKVVAGSETNIINVDLKNPTDPRIDVNLGRFSTPFYDWDVPVSLDGYLRDPGNGGLYYPLKHLPTSKDKGTLSVSTSTGSTAKNYHVMRFADVKLLYAEALIMSGGSLEEARTQINDVRARAAKDYVEYTEFKPDTASTVIAYDDAPFTVTYHSGLTATSTKTPCANYGIGLWPASQFDTPENAMKALRAERRAEFALEGHRWYDVVRWGIHKNYLTEYANYESNFLVKFDGIQSYNEKWITLPIPVSQITTMEGLLVQNENWK